MIICLLVAECIGNEKGKMAMTWFDWRTFAWFGWVLLISARLIMRYWGMQKVPRDDNARPSRGYVRIVAIPSVVIVCFGLTAMWTHSLAFGVITGILVFVVVIFGFPYLVMGSPLDGRPVHLVMLARGPGWKFFGPREEYIPAGKWNFGPGYYLPGVEGECTGGCYGGYRGETVEARTGEEIHYRPLITVQEEMSRAEFLSIVQEMRQGLRIRVAEMLNEGNQPDEIARYLAAYRSSRTEVSVRMECVSYRRPEVVIRYPDPEPDTDSAQQQHETA